MAKREKTPDFLGDRPQQGRRSTTKPQGREPNSPRTPQTSVLAQPTEGLQILHLDPAVHIFPQREEPISSFSTTIRLMVTAPESVAQERVGLAKVRVRNTPMKSQAGVSPYFCYISSLLTVVAKLN